MAYETGSASSVNDLLDKLRIFALAAGWTVDYWGNRTNAGGASQGNGLNALAINKGGHHFVLYHDTSSSSTSDPTPRIRSYSYVGPWVSASGSDLQAVRSTTVSANNVPLPGVAYHFFTDSARAYLHAVVEITPGRFTHFGLGVLEKVGGGSECPYVYGLRWNFSASAINSATSAQHALPWDNDCGSSSLPAVAFRADSDGVSPRFYEMKQDSSDTTMTGGGGFRSNNSGSGYAHLGRELMRHAPSALTGRAVLVPAIVLAERSAGVSSLVGTPPDLRLVRIDNVAQGAVMTIGADEWKTFPVIRKNGPTGTENSAGYGYAFRVVA